MSGREESCNAQDPVVLGEFLADYGAKEQCQR